MRLIILIVSIATIYSGCSRPVKGRNGQVYKNAVEYNDYIISRQNRIINKILDFVKVSETDLDSAGRLLTKYANETEEIINEVRGMSPFKGDSAFRDAAAETFTFYVGIFNKEYKQIINLRQQGANETQEGIDEMNKILQQMAIMEEKYDKIFHNSQRDFADRNNMKLGENEMQKKLDKLTEE